MADAKTKTDETYEIRAQRVRTLDSRDYDLGWTVQAPDRPEEPPENNPVTFTRDELPDPAAMVEQGVPLESYLAHFISNLEDPAVVAEILQEADEAAVEDVQSTGTTKQTTTKKTS